MEAEKKALNASMVSLTVLICTVLFTVTSLVQAYPVTSNISITPSNPWIGWDVGISTDCIDDSGNQITRVYTNVSGPGISFSEIDLVPISGSTYNIDLLGSDLTEIGIYSVSVGCRNDLGEEQSVSSSFRVSELSGAITSVSDIGYFGDEGIIYADEKFDAYFLIKKDDVPVTHNIDFYAILNNQDMPIQTPIPYWTGKGQRLRMTAPNSDGNYMLELLAEFQGESVLVQTGVQVRDLLKLEILSIDKSSISEVEPVNVRIKATERGNAIAITESDLRITLVNDDNAEYDVIIESVKQDSSGYTIEITPPNLVPGRYRLRIEFDYNGKGMVEEEDLYYTIPISGEISHNGKGMVVELQFTDDDGLTRSWLTDSKGLYSGQLSPGTYDITLRHRESKLILYDVDITEFDDPIRYYYLGDRPISGIDNAGLFVFEAALSYSSAFVELHYMEKSVDGPESALGVYRCSDWNGEECYSEWEELDSDVDTVRNSAEVTVSSLSAFAVGTREGIKSEISLDKEEYNLYDDLHLDGLAIFDDNHVLADAAVTGIIKGTSKSATTTTNQDGVFNLDFTVPDEPGEYTIKVTIEKEPFSSISAEKIFNVVKSRSLSIDIPTGIKLEAKGNKIINFTIKNTGQLELTDVTITFEDVTDAITVIMERDNIGALDPQEEASLSFDLISLLNSTTTYTMKVVVDSDEGVGAEKSIAVTTERRSGNLAGIGGPDNGSDSSNSDSGFSLPDFSLVAGVISNISGGVGYLLALFVGSVSFAILMRKKRLSRVLERDWITNKLSSMRLEIGKPEGYMQESAVQPKQMPVKLVSYRAERHKHWVNKDHAKKAVAQSERLVNHAGAEGLNRPGQQSRSVNPLAQLVQSMNEASRPRKSTSKLRKKKTQYKSKKNKTKGTNKKKGGRKTGKTRRR
jgi:hypothetical protein